MLQVRRVLSKDIDLALHELILQHCIAAQAELTATNLTKYYSWIKLSTYLITSADYDYLFILYDGDNPIGLMNFSEVPTVHLSCRCVIDNILYIKPTHRSIKHLFALIKGAEQALASNLNTSFVLIVGSSDKSMDKVYKRLGYSLAGTHLTKEIEGYNNG